MSWNQDKFLELGNALIKLSGQGANLDRESGDYKRAERLIKQLFTSNERSVVSNLSLELILQDMNRRKELIEKRQEVYLDEAEARQSILNVKMRAERMLQQKIKMLVTSEDYSEEELEELQEELKVLKKSNKLEQDSQKMEKKGAAMAETLLQATLGISKNSLNVAGGVKGFGKGLKKSVNAGNVMATVVTKAFEIFMSVDGAAAKLFKQQGTEKFKKTVMSVGSDLALAFDASDDAAAEMTNELRNTQKTFDQQTPAEIANAVRTAGYLNAMGVSAQAYAETTKFMRSNLGMHVLQQNKILGKFYQMAKDTSLSPEQVFREAAETLPTYSRYGKNFVGVFAGMFHAARRTNVDIQDLKELTESLDTSENALKSAAKMNALLGGQFINPAELLGADPGKKVQLIAEAYQRPEAQTGEIHPRVVRSLYKNFQLDAQKFNNIVNANFEGYDEEINKVVSGTPNLMKDVREDIKKSMSIGDSITRTVAVMFRAVFKELLPYIVDLAGYVISFLKIAIKFSPAGMLLSVLDGSALQLFKDVTGISAKERVEEEKREKKRVEDLSHDFLGGGMTELLTPEQAEHFVATAGTTGQMGPTIETFASSDPMEQFAATVLESRDAAEQAKLKSKERLRQSQHVHIAGVGAMKMMDSPTTIGMTSAGDGNVTVPDVPLVHKNFETASSDDLLISKMTILRDKLHEFRNKKTRTTITVGDSVIGEAMA